MDTLSHDPDFRATTFVVIDFETTTPPGTRPEPIDVAALWLHARDGMPTRTGRRFQALIRPPAHAPVSAPDTYQTGITPAMVAGQPAASQVLARLDRELDTMPTLLIAHNAPTEAGILYDYRDHCPQLAMTWFLDTVKLARAAYPDLASHNLDALLLHLQIPVPAGRHRAMPDVEVTASLFIRILAEGGACGKWRTLADLRRAASYQPRATRPVQDALFDL
jgi:DNA polymerase III subunit epsilon